MNFVSERIREIQAEIFILQKRLYLYQSRSNHVSEEDEVIQNIAQEMQEKYVLLNQLRRAHA